MRSISAIDQTCNFKDTKASILVFSVDISKSEEISRWRPIDKDLHCDFSATKMFFEHRHVWNIIT